MLLLLAGANFWMEQIVADGSNQGGIDQVHGLHQNEMEHQSEFWCIIALCV